MSNISKDTFQFLEELKENNNRDWFTANKARYEAAKAEFETFVDALISRISEFDPSIAHHTAKECVFRIYRDVRFSADKSPYKTHMGAHITSAAKKSEIHSKAGYYIHLCPGETMLAGGAYQPQGPWLKAIRQEIHYHLDEWQAILNNQDFITYFGTIEGEKLQKAPKDYPADHPALEWLKHKSFLATHYPNDAKVLDRHFLNHCASVFQALFPFDRFLNRAMD
ncbi:MAG TPA: DUF2461 domain-containing protein [Saprospiraceae bacterium]|nr:DUF2461 domain-containing protein [Saprospiraceae bacterium]HMQ83774.1 DUF2461 domain-containing protein [Saprospiraceae bacterium]